MARQGMSDVLCEVPELAEEVHEAGHGGTRVLRLMQVLAHVGVRS